MAPGDDAVTSSTGWHTDATHAPPRQSWPQAPQLLGSFVVSLQPPPELLLELAAELATLDAALLDAPTELALAAEEPAVEAAPPTPPAPVFAVLDAAPPAPPTPAADAAPPAPEVLIPALAVALLDASLVLPCAVSVTTTEPQPAGPAIAAAATLAARLANQACSRDGILVGPDFHIASPRGRTSHGAGARSRKFRDEVRGATRTFGRPRAPSAKCRMDPPSQVRWKRGE